MIATTISVVTVVERIVTKTFVLNLLEPTRTKQRLVDELIARYRKALELVVSKKKIASKFDLQKMHYEMVRLSGVPSMMACYLFGDAKRILRTNGKVHKVALPFNIPRSGNIFATRRGNPVLSIRTCEKRIAMPIANDGAYKRFRQKVNDGWHSTAFRIVNAKAFVTTMKKFDIEPDQTKYVSTLGVDVGVNCLAAVSVIEKSGAILRQLYLGRDVGKAQRDIGIRRSKLRSLRDQGSRYAKQALRKLRRHESNFVKTRCEQVAHEIIGLAREYNSLIAVEDLLHLNSARGGRKGNRKSKRLPYRRFRAVLESLATQDGRLVVPIHPRGTSHMCSNCDSRGVRKGVLFKCRACGYLGNADRNASVNIARRAAAPRLGTGQISARNLSVMAGVLVHGGVR